MWWKFRPSNHVQKIVVGKKYVSFPFLKIRKSYRNCSNWTRSCKTDHLPSPVYKKTKWASYYCSWTSSLMPPSQASIKISIIPLIRATCISLCVQELLEKALHGVHREEEMVQDPRDFARLAQQRRTIESELTRVRQQLADASRVSGQLNRYA